MYADHSFTTIIFLNGITANGPLTITLPKLDDMSIRKCAADLRYGIYSEFVLPLLLIGFAAVTATLENGTVTENRVKLDRLQAGLERSF